MDINSRRAEMITGKSIEEASEKLNLFLDQCGSRQIETHEIEYYPLHDKESEDKHGYLVRYDRYSQPFKEEYLRAEGENRIAKAKEYFSSRSIDKNIE